MAQEPTDNDKIEKDQTKETESPNNDKTVNSGASNDKSEAKTQDNEDNDDKNCSSNKVSSDDVKDNTNDEEKKYESKEDIEARNKAQQIPQNLEAKPLGKKNKIVIGSFEPSTFHYSFKNQKDPLQIGMFPIFGYLQIPHIGVYGDSYGR